MWTVASRGTSGSQRDELKELKTVNTWNFRYKVDLYKYRVLDNQTK